MSFETVFLFIHLPTFAGWALLFLKPNARITIWLVHSGLIPLFMGGIYGMLLFSGIFLGHSDPDAGMSSIAGVSALFSHPVGVLTGWSHFIVFDLFVGAWIARDAHRHGLNHLGTLPSLLLSMVFGPLGLVWHIIRRLVAGHGFNLTETQ